VILLTYYRDLYERRSTSRAKLIQAAFMAAGLLLLIILLNQRPRAFSWLEWTVIVVILAATVEWTLLGLGYRMERCFGKAFIAIDDAGVTIKATFRDKVLRMPWENVQRVSSSSDIIRLELQDGESVQISLRTLNTAARQEVAAMLERWFRERRSQVPLYNGGGYR
jgi:uncharacterized integral membrane protein